MNINEFDFEDCVENGLKGIQGFLKTVPCISSHRV